MTTGQRDSIQVSGAGLARGTPDVAHLTLAVEAEAASVAAALAECSRLSEAVLGELRRLGSNAPDVTTTSLSLSPRWNHESNTIIGQVASQSVLVHLRDIGLVGAVLESASGAAGDALRLHGLSWSVAHPGPLLEEARALAFADARSKATQLAGLAGRRLGPVLEITEAEPGHTPVRLAALREAAFDAVEPGESTLSASILVRWAFL